MLSDFSKQRQENLNTTSQSIKTKKSLIDKLLENAEKNSEQYRNYIGYAQGHKDKEKVLVFTCMDERILPDVLFLKGVGDLVIVRNAGAYLTGDVIRSMIIGIYEGNIKEIMIIGHKDCKMTKVVPERLKTHITRKTGVYSDEIDYYTGGFNSWLKAFSDPIWNVKRSLNILKRHPLIPKDVIIRGFIFDEQTGRLEEVFGGD
ncbi:MAG: carbonic anhydrase [Candidatus Odinarchaeota archaeon]|nr:carbonic anhydrase [Candidatus Odinarchaeota archaeon]